MIEIIDVNETGVLKLYPEVLEMLLKDHTTTIEHLLDNRIVCRYEQLLKTNRTIDSVIHLKFL